MKRLFALLLAIVLLLSPCALAEDAEDEGGEGEVIFLDSKDLSGLGEAAASEPFVPDDVTRTILGSDDRVSIKNTKEYPYSAIAYIDVKFKCGCKTTGSGFMIGKKALITAAHILVCHKHGKWANRMTFYFGYRSNKNYLYRYNARWEAYVGDTFPDGYRTDGDWGYVRFSKNVGEKTGWLGMKFLSDSDLQAGRYYVTGYRYGKMTYNMGKARAINTNLMYIDADTLPGNSGCPVYTPDYYAVGIVIAQSDDSNTGFRLNTMIYNKLRSEGII